jgi:predicted alpha/beta-fold hydrolase
VSRLSLRIKADFDRRRTVTWGYPTENAYYRDASSADAVLAVRIPFLAISALDDPVGSALRDS